MGQPELSQDLSAERAITPLGFEGLARKNDQGFYELSVLISGVHCAACIQNIEGALKKHEDVQKAQLNFATQTLSLNWAGAPEKANDFVEDIEKLGYKVHPYDPRADQEKVKHEERFLLLCLGVAGFAMGNIMLLSLGLWMTNAQTMGIATRDFMHSISALIALPAIAFSGRPFFRSAINALKHKRTNMDVPISLALLLTCAMSLYETTHHGEHVYFDSAVMLMFFLLIGRYLDFRARLSARSAATDLAGTLSGFATILEQNKSRRIAIRDLDENMNVMVAAGERIPADGLVITGQSEVDVSLITGETRPQDIAENEIVYAGTINLSAPLVIRVLKKTQDTLLSDIIRLMENAEQSRARYVRIADHAARLYTPVVHSCALLAFIGWFFIVGVSWQNALMIAITVLIMTCPCALALAVPVVQVLATGRLMKKGILVKSGDALERLAQIDTFLLDKTGTLTLGKPVLEGEYIHKDLQLAASLATYSRHPTACALASSIDTAEIWPLSDVKEHPGQGMSAIFEEETVRLGNRAWIDVPNQQGCSTKIELWLHHKNQKTGFYFGDKIRVDTPETIQLLKAENLKIIMLTGDREEVARDVAKQCKINEFYAMCKPQEKHEILTSLKNKEHKVCMVGDGLNDAPVLAAAHVSMAPGTAIDMAQNAADIIFMGDKFSSVYTVYKTALKAQKLVNQNFILAVGYNLVAIPLAISGLVTPLIAAIAMSCSSLIVILNSFRLRSDI